MGNQPYILWFDEIGLNDLPSVGGKNASLGEMRRELTRQGVNVPNASFAGQQETFLNIRGEYALVQACKRCFASLFTNRAISYRAHRNFDHLQVALSIGVQKMVRSDRACSGVLFTMDTESGFPHVVYITGSYGLGENIVQGVINPDEFYVFKP